MKIARGVLIVFLLLMPAFAWADDAVYRYPIADLYAATILGTPQNLRPELGESGECSHRAGRSKVYMDWEGVIQ